ncbi:hypothetical protein TRFO_21123 [Tritrichomonas foetus]|uniref:Uncharacterized protein n=1 Tax=Tritrichomonas foetus TaxID=1144522 RepID=A0A1J4KEI8_9EUKA|nr:hypothetical protein TRFO_21123 [Tritrichomonas foetus]|eukprot:OHT09841.1 hypothetical protein TRFO_21123 [Tritrichomonas foetus]
MDDSKHRETLFNGPPPQSYIEHSDTLEQALTYRENEYANLLKLKKYRRYLSEMRNFQLIELDLQNSQLLLERIRAQKKAFELSQKIDDYLVGIDTENAPRDFRMNSIPSPFMSMPKNQHKKENYYKPVDQPDDSFVLSFNSLGIPNQPKFTSGDSPLFNKNSRNGMRVDQQNSSGDSFFDDEQIPWSQPFNNNNSNSYFPNSPPHQYVSQFYPQSGYSNKNGSRVPFQQLGNSR